MVEEVGLNWRRRGCRLLDKMRVVDALCIPVGTNKSTRSQDVKGLEAIPTLV